MMDNDPLLPGSLDRFGDDLVSRLQVLRRRSRRRRVAASGVAAMALLAGTAIAATRALDGSPRGYHISHDTFIIDPAQVLYGQFQRDLRTDTRGRPLEIALPRSSGRLAGDRAQIRRVQGGYCVQLVSTTRCGRPGGRIPVISVGIAMPNAPDVYTGVEASNVVRHIISCGGSSENVTSNAGAHLFLYVAPSDRRAVPCTQTVTLRGGGTTTVALRA